jgi:hypothetical protein
MSFSGSPDIGYIHFRLILNLCAKKALPFADGTHRLELDRSKPQNYLCAEIFPPCTVAILSFGRTALARSPYLLSRGRDSSPPTRQLSQVLATVSIPVSSGYLSRDHYQLQREALPARCLITGHWSTAWPDSKGGTVPTNPGRRLQRSKPALIRRQVLRLVRLPCQMQYSGRQSLLPCWFSQRGLNQTRPCFVAASSVLCTVQVISTARRILYPRRGH